jgi:ABC-type xylose transport system substrate-binding protein
LQKVGFVVDLRFAKTENEQTEQFRTAVNHEPLTIIIGAVDGKSLKDTLAEAAAQGIPVIAYDRLIWIPRTSPTSSASTRRKSGACRRAPSSGRSG